MNPKRLQDAIGNIDDAFIKEAADAAKAQRICPRVWIPAASLAACVLLTAALLPWKTFFSGNAPSSTDPQISGTDVLQNDDTSVPDTTKGKDDHSFTAPEITHDSKQSGSPQSDAVEKEEAQSSPAPQITLSAAPVVTPVPDTTGPYLQDTDISEPEETTAIEKETAGQSIPDGAGGVGNIPVVPQRPTILSHSVYPVQKMYPSVESQRIEWRLAMSERINGYKDGIGDTDSFVSRTVYEFFSNAENENLIYSPVNTYMALGMLAEMSEGQSRAQLLDLLSKEDICSLRSSAKNLWNCCYRDDGIVTTVLGSSMWLDNSFVPKTAVTDILAENYYATSFYGSMGDEAYDSLMRSWLNEQTKGLLEDTVENKSLDPDSVMALMSTVYFKANWEDDFGNVGPKATQDFYTPNGKVSAQFMSKVNYEIYYEGENFKATRLRFEEGKAMWFILPDKEVSLQSLFSDEEAMSFITGEAQASGLASLPSSYSIPNVCLSLPKFDITSEVDLAKGLEKLGITDVFDPSRADLSTLTDSKISVSEINHSVRVRVDEKGCEAAQIIENVLPAWPGLNMSMGFVDSVKFTLNRPFIFVVTSDSDIPLFVGTVNCPN